MATVFAPISSMTAAEYKGVTDVTYLGYVHGTLAALRRMRARDQGTIVQVGSALAYRSIPLQSACRCHDRRSSGEARQSAYRPARPVRTTTVTGSVLIMTFALPGRSCCRVTDSRGRRPGRVRGRP